MRSINGVIYEELMSCHQEEMHKEIGETECTIEFNIDDYVFYNLALAAEYHDVTFNAYMNEIIKDYIKDVL